MSIIKPLFKWAGGKTRYLKYLECYLKENDVFVEPFLGGGSVFCFMYNKNRIKKNIFILNDIQTELMTLYSAIKNNTEEFIEKSKQLEHVYLSLAYQERKSFYNNTKESYWMTQDSSTLFFLLKTCFNGIWQSNKKSNGLFATPPGLLNEKSSFIDSEMIRNWSIALQHAELYSTDFSKIEVPKKSTVYCDPPYRDSFTTYSTTFDDNDQRRLYEWCDDLSNNGCYVVMSNKSDGEFFENINKGKIYYFNATHTAGRRKQERNNAGEIFSYSAKKVKECVIIFDKTQSLV